jgi:hypothetical protein
VFHEFYCWPFTSLPRTLQHLELLDFRIDAGVVQEQVFPTITRLRALTHLSLEEGSDADDSSQLVDMNLRPLIALSTLRSLALTALHSVLSKPSPCPRSPA